MKSNNYWREYGSLFHGKKIEKEEKKEMSKKRNGIVPNVCDDALGIVYSFLPLEDHVSLEQTCKVLKNVGYKPGAWSKNMSIEIKNIEQLK